MQHNFQNFVAKNVNITIPKRLKCQSETESVKNRQLFLGFLTSRRLKPSGNHPDEEDQ